jgi:hypothetical protein
MKFLHRKHLATSILLALLSSIIPGQSQTSNSRPTATPAATGSSAHPYDLEINNGFLVRGAEKVEATLANVIDNVRQRYPEANIAMSPGMARIKVSDLKLRTLGLAQELEAIRVASGEKFSATNLGADPHSSKPNQGLFTLRETTTPDRERMVEAFNIGPYLRNEAAEQQSEDAIRKRVREVEEMIVMTLRALHDSDAEKLQFQFHPGASLFVAIGSSQDVGVARKIISALPGQPVIEPRSQFGSSAENEAFRRRYGLDRMPQPTPTNPRDTQADEFRKRYGLPPNQTPGNKPQEPPSAGQKP